MKLNKIVLFLLLTLAVISCTRVDLEDMLNPEPSSKGKVTLTTDWSKRSAGIEQPASYTVEINKQKLTYTQSSNLLPELEADTYPILIYNTSDQITINGTIATVTTAANQVEPLPGWLFTAIAEAEYVNDSEKTITAAMQQQVRQLTIELTVTEGDPNRISAATASLTGIANTLDFETNTYSGTSLSIVPVFSRNDNKLLATAHLLGMSTEIKKLILDITFSDGRTQHIESDLSSLLTDFNSDKHIPKTLSANLILPTQAGFDARINGWKASDGSDGTAQ